MERDSSVGTVVGRGMVGERVPNDVEVEVSG